METKEKWAKWLKCYLDEGKDTFLNATESVKQSGIVPVGVIPPTNVGFGIRQVLGREINEYLNNNGWPKANYEKMRLLPRRMRWLKYYVTEGPTYHDSENAAIAAGYKNSTALNRFIRANEKFFEKILENYLSQADGTSKKKNQINHHYLTKKNKHQKHAEWIGYFLDESNPKTFLNVTQSSLKAGFTSRVGRRVKKELMPQIERWLKSHGYSQDACKKVLYPVNHEHLKRYLKTTKKMPVKATPPHKPPVNMNECYDALVEEHMGVCGV